MTVSREPTYAAHVLHAAGTILNDDIRRVQVAAERKHGPLKITGISLRPVAEEQREVYDVYVTMEPVPAPTTGESNEPVT